MRFALFAALLIGCVSSTETSADLAAPTDDMAVAVDMTGGDASGSDMTAAPDLLGIAFCDHLRAAVAGAPASDCAVAYLASIMKCFRPAGACGRAPLADPNKTGGYLSCWANGAVEQFTFLAGNDGWGYRMPDGICGTMAANAPYPGTPPLPWAFFCAATTGYDCEAASNDMAGTGAQFQNDTFICPDGTQVVIGPINVCPELISTLLPVCDRTVDAGSGCAF